MKGRKKILTEREKECLLFVANGKSYDYAPEYLGMSRNTLLSHLKNIYLKLCVNDKAEAVYKAIIWNLIPAERQEIPEYLRIA